MPDLFAAMLIEIDQRAKESEGLIIETLYFGGGTPSMLNPAQIDSLLNKLHQYFHFHDSIEFTIEANPEDVYCDRLNHWSTIGVNRVSLGIQSFLEEDLLWMNRTHDAKQSHRAIEEVIDHGFSNLTIDLMYGLPNSNVQKLASNLNALQEYEVPHFSAYALTLEERTALKHWVSKDQIQILEDADTIEQMEYILDFCEVHDYEAYEISNFSKPGFRSQHNSAYWEGKPYIGIGPSAHSYDGHHRRWNIANNNQYVANIRQSKKYFDMELLSECNRFNEFILLNLRRKEGIQLDELRIRFPQFIDAFTKEVVPALQKGELLQIGNRIVLSNTGKAQADRISADLFQVDHQ